MRILTWLSFLIFLSLTFSSTPWAQGDARDVISLEGIIVDSSRPEESIAIVNGTPLEKGDHVGPYELIAISPRSIRVRHKSDGSEKLIRMRDITELNSDKTAAEFAAESAEAAIPEEGEKGNFWDRWAKQWNPSKILNWVWERKAVVDLITVYNAGTAYFNTKQKLAPDLITLVDAEYLSKSFQKDVRGQYVFYLGPITEGFSAHADPVDPESELKYFYVGQNAIIRFEIGKPAGPKSLPHDL